MRRPCSFLRCVFQDEIEWRQEFNEMHMCSHLTYFGHMTRHVLLTSNC